MLFGGVPTQDVIVDGNRGPIQWQVVGIVRVVFLRRSYGGFAFFSHHPPTVLFLISRPPTALLLVPLPHPCMLRYYYCYCCCAPFVPVKLIENQVQGEDTADVGARAQAAKDEGSQGARAGFVRDVASGWLHRNRCPTVETVQ